MRVIVCALLLVALFAGGNGLYARDVAYNQSILSRMTPRVEGSENERQAIDSIASELARIGVAYRIDDFSHYTERFSRSRNIYAYIEGTSDQNMVLAAAINRSSSYSLALLLTMVERYSLSKPRANIIIALLGADYLEGEYIGIGSELLLESLSSTVVDLLVYVNIDRDPEVMEVDIGTAGRVVRRDVIGGMIGAAEEAGQRISIPAFWRTTFAGRRSAAGSAGSAGSPTDFFLINGTPALTLSTGEHSPLDRSYTVVSSLELLAAHPSDSFSSADSRYLLFPLGRSFYILGAHTVTYVLIALFILVLGVGYFGAESVRKRYYSLMRRHILLFLLHLLALFSAVYGARFALEALLGLVPISELWRELPLLALTLKLVISIMLYNLFAAVIVYVYPTPTSDAYIAFALILGGGSQLIAIVNLFLTTVTIWIFLGTICFALVRGGARKAIVFCVILSVSLAYLTLYFISAPADLYRVVIFSSAAHSLVLTLVVLPYFFMYMRLRALRTSETKHSVGYILLGSYIVLGMLIFIFYDFVAPVPKDILLSEVLDQTDRTHTLRYNSNTNRNTGISFDLTTPSQYLVTTPRITERSLALEYHPVYWLSHTTEEVTGYHTHRLTLNGEVGVRSADIIMVAERPIMIVETEVPYLNLTPRTVQFYTGRSPTLPISISFSVPDTTSYPFTVQMMVVPDRPLVDTAVRISAAVQTTRSYRINTTSIVMIEYTIDHDNS